MKGFGVEGGGGGGGVSAYIEEGFGRGDSICTYSVTVCVFV